MSLLYLKILSLEWLMYLMMAIAVRLPLALDLHSKTRHLLLIDYPRTWLLLVLRLVCFVLLCIWWYLCILFGSTITRHGGLCCILHFLLARSQWVRCCELGYHRWCQLSYCSQQSYSRRVTTSFAASLLPSTRLRFCLFWEWVWIWD